MIVKDIGRVALQGQKSPIISDLEELLSLPGSEIPPALGMMAGQIDCTLSQMIVTEPERHGSLWERAKRALSSKKRCLCLAKTVLPEGKICGQCLQIGLARLRHYRVEVLRAIKAADSLSMTKQVEMWTQEYVNKIPSGLTMALEGTFKRHILQNFCLRTKVWGRELNPAGFTAHSLYSSFRGLLPAEAMELVGKIKESQHLIPFFVGFEVMTKGDDPFLVMACQYNVKLAFYEWGER